MRPSKPSRDADGRVAFPSGMPSAPTVLFFLERWMCDEEEI